MATFTKLPGSKKTLLAGSRAIGPVDKSQLASLTVRVRSSGNLQKLEKLVYQQAGKPVHQRSYLTREQLATQYGARPADLDRVEQAAQNHNLIILHRSSAERSLVLHGALGDLLTLFPANVQMYHHASGPYRGRQGDIMIPDDLDGIVTGIFGFDTRPKHRSPHQHKATAAATIPKMVPSPVYAKRYNFPTTFQRKALDGSGQTIAIVELGGGFVQSDLAVYFSKIQVPMPNVVSISIDKAGNTPNKSNADGEVMLDIEVAGAVAPKANIAVYFAPNAGNKGFIDAISTIVHDTERKPDVISISWGGPENSSDVQGFNNFHELFVAAAAVGITICVASGDHGTADMASPVWDGKIHVDHPSVDPMVLSCGGTQIDPKTDTDVVWNDGTAFDPNVQGGGGWAGGGGVSEMAPVPSYQSNIKMPVSLVTKKKGRGVPDIAMSATNYYVRVDGREGGSGGTSAVAPLMAGLIVLLNQAKQKNVGFINPFLYSKKGVTKDVSKGTNAIKSTIKGYKAGKGWDACTGLGTPDGTAILNLL